MESRTTKLILALVIIVALGLVGFTLYQAFTGVGEIGTVVLFLFISIIAIGLVKLGISSNDTKLDLNNFVPLLLMISTPIVLFFVFDKLGIKIFSMVGSIFSTFGVSGAVNIDVNFTGSVVDFIRKYLLFFVIGVVVLFWQRENITKGLRETFK